MKTPKRKRLTITLLIVAGVLLVILAAALIYLTSGYEADEAAVNAFLSDIDIEEFEKDGYLVFKPQKASLGLIFYPGGKVDHRAYIPLMRACAANGILAILVEMPFDLAILDVDAADGIQASFPTVRSWYIGGHSLGGAMAASYLENEHENYDGLILLAAYSTADLSQTNLKVLSVYGSEDGILNFEKYEKNKSNLPEDFKEVELSGACHAYFGIYGAQKGDGNPKIQNDEQIFLSAKEISRFVFDY